MQMFPNTGWCFQSNTAIFLSSEGQSVAPPLSKNYLVDQFNWEVLKESEKEYFFIEEMYNVEDIFHQETRQGKDQLSPCGSITYWTRTSVLFVEVEVNLLSSVFLFYKSQIEHQS